MKSIFRTLPMKVTAFIFAVAAGTATAVLMFMTLLALDQVPIIGPNFIYYAADLPKCIIIGIVTFILFAVFTVYLIVVSGKVNDSEEPHIAPLNKIPFDLFLAVAFVCFILLFIALTYCVSYGYQIQHWEETIDNQQFVFSRTVGFYWSSLAAFGAACAGELTIILAMVMSFSARVKSGKWWKNTVIFLILNMLYKAAKKIFVTIRRVFCRLPDVWKLLVSFVAYLIIDWFLLYHAYENYNNNVALGLFIIFNLAVLLLVCYTGVNFDMLERGSKKLASGELDSKIDTAQLKFIFRRHAENINAIGDGMQRAIDQRLRSERMKTELIANVSHDIKTPVTSIVNYADLLSGQQLPEPAAEYADVLLRQSKRLAKLTTDILEASKASTGNISLELSVVDVSELISQSVGEYAELLAEQNIEAVINTPAQELFALADGRLLWRITDNLLSNVCKYAMPYTRLYVDVKQIGAGASVIFKNISKHPLNIDSDELTERFVRGDAARSSDGSGLGLNIAKSLTELQKGFFEITVDGDLFKVEIRLFVSNK